MKALARPSRATLLICLILTGCSTIATFDKTAYDKATGAKAEALALIDTATEPYATRSRQAEAALLAVDKAYEYDRGRTLNKVTLKQWEILRNPKGNLFGGFVRRWKEKGALQAAYVEEKKPDIAEAFDQIIQLERGKRAVTSN